jgi:hypothetical protein
MITLEWIIFEKSLFSYYRYYFKEKNLDKNKYIEDIKIEKEKQ